MNKPRRTSRRFKVTAVAVTLVLGLTLGFYLAKGTSLLPGRPLDERSTGELLRIVERRDNWLRQSARAVIGWLPRSVARHLPPPRTLYPDFDKPAALAVLGARTNESARIVPVLTRQLDPLQPRELLAGEYVAALARHGRAASNALPWLEAVARDTTNTAHLGRRFTAGMSSIDPPGIYAALALITGDSAKLFTQITNQLSEFCLPRPDGAAIAGAASLEARPAFQERIASLMEALNQLAVDPREKVRFLERLLDSPSLVVQNVAFSHLVSLDPQLPELRTYALRRLNDPATANSNYLRQLLSWAAKEPGLVPQFEAATRTAISSSSSWEYWMIAEQISALGTNGHRFAGALITRLLDPRQSSTDAAAWSYVYGAAPSFAEFLLTSKADLSGLRERLKAASLDVNNRQRLNDAQFHTRLGGDPGLELELLTRTLASAPTSARKNLLERYAELEPDRAKAVNFLVDCLNDSDPQYRRHALVALSHLGNDATNRLQAIDRMITADPSTIVRWQANRTANILRGLDPKTGLHAPSGRDGAPHP